jgi:nucleolar complex protein 3
LHLIDLVFLSELITCLKKLPGYINHRGELISLSEHLQCCIVAFKVLRINFDALNVDLQGYFVQLFKVFT